MSDDPKALADQLVDWRLGHHLEAAAKVIAASVYALARSLDNLALRHERLAETQARATQIQEQILHLQEESAASVKVMRELTARLRPFAEPDPKPGDPPRSPPEWIKDVMEGD